LTGGIAAVIVLLIIGLIILGIRKVNRPPTKLETPEEAWALKDEVTGNPPKVDPSKARHPVRMIAVG